MIVVPPIDCTAPGVLVATNAADAPAWSAGTTYALDATCSKGGRTWLSLQAANVGHDPETSPLWWYDSGPLNSMALFDNSVATPTVTTGGLSFTLATGQRVTNIALMGLKGASVDVSIVDGATVLHTEHRVLFTGNGTYYGFCFEEFDQTREALFPGVQCTPGAHITITINGSGITACGLCVVGKQFYIGQAQYGFAMPIEDRGRHYLDALDNPVNIERGYSKGCSGSLVNTRANFNRLVAFFAEHVGIPMLWIADPSQKDLLAATAYGRYVRAVVVIESYDSITSAIEIAGYR